MKSNIIFCFCLKSWPLGQIGAHTYLVYVEPLNEGAELCETLAATPTDTHQEHVPLRLLDDSTNAGDVLDGKLEEHQVHRVIRHLIVILQIRLHHFE